MLQIDLVLFCFGQPFYFKYFLGGEGLVDVLVSVVIANLLEFRDDNNALSGGPDFWIVTGLSIYVVINFFVFLFYISMLNTDPLLADKIWNVHNIAFIIFCIFITKAFYGPFRNKYTE